MYLLVWSPWRLTMWYSNSGEPNGRRRRRRSAVGQSSILIMYFKPTKALISIFWSGAAVLRFRESPIEPDRFDLRRRNRGQSPGAWFVRNQIRTRRKGGAIGMKRSYLYTAVFLFLPAVLWAQFSLADLPRLKDYESERASSYDRTGGNHDYVSVDPGQTVTIFDSDGPGEIRHIWTTIPGWSEIYV